MSLRTKEELAKIKPLSRFVEHFDLMPPTELLDASSIEEGPTKKITPLYALNPSVHKESANSAYSPTSYTMERHVSSTSHNNIQGDPSTVSYLTSNVDPIASSSTSLPKIRNSPSSSQPASRRYKTTNGLDLNLFKQGMLVSKSTLPRPGSHVKSTSTSLNRAEVIIKRYESWDTFLSLICTWISDTVRLSIKSQKSSGNLMKASKSEGLNKQQGYTADLASMKDFSQRLKVQIPILEKFRKECQMHLKTLKNRPDLNIQEFLKRAQVTVNLMTQLKAACEEARRTIEQGSQLTNDPWLANLYVLRQLKREVDEENRLRLLMVPVQRAMHDFETRVMKAVEQAFTVGFERPDLIQEDKLASLQASLNNAVTDNWDTFVANHSKSLVMDTFLLKHYLNINYACKNDPLVMTLHKGELERRSGVLNKYTQRFFVLTESGFMHQFKLNDKVSPEYSIYVPGSTIIPGVDISQLNLYEQTQPKPSGHYSFEIQRPGSILQRDKSFVFRTFRIEDMVIWTKLLIDVAVRPLDAILHLKNTTLMTSPPLNSSAGSSLRTSPELMTPSLKQPLQAQDQVTTPPPSPIEKIVANNAQASLSVNDNSLHPPPLPVIAPVIPPPQSPPADNAYLDIPNALKPKLYSPQLNI